ncbi:hypothetical protein NUW58_g189 [Xylaria curta]|uniref:Uncharacterized protein n=1 Tax=Xylaria curta TaxID=42375 RepID=A0ACC1PRX8_9PEZI|nr:hypothetical protein NUW58_g189 [Xylaria curta]
MATEIFDVFVVGGGPVGLAAAYEVAMIEGRVIILEKNNFFNYASSSNNLAYSIFVLDYVPQEYLRGSVVVFPAGWAMKFVLLLGKVLTETSLHGEFKYARQEVAIARRGPNMDEDIIIDDTELHEQAKVLSTSRSIIRAFAPGDPLGDPFPDTRGAVQTPRNKETTLDRSSPQTTESDSLIALSVPPTSAPQATDLVGRPQRKSMGDLISPQWKITPIHLDSDIVFTDICAVYIRRPEIIDNMPEEPRPIELLYGSKTNMFG